MTNPVRNRLALLLSAGLVLALAGCGLPRSGPSKAEIEAGGDETTLPFEIVEVTDSVARNTARDEALSFQVGFLRSATQDVNLIGPGDALSITVWENVDNGLLASVGQKFTVLQETQVDQAGYIFVPYVGRIRAAGNSPDGLRRVITNGLSGQTPDPQVEVRRLIANSATVSILGSVTVPGVYPIEAPTRRMISMLSKAGGIAVEPEVAVVTLRRGNVTSRVWLQDLYDKPEIDVALRGGDSIIVERDRRAFTALGALGSQQRVPFPSRNISAIEAIGLVGGLNTQISDPTGIFIFRTEDPRVASTVIDDAEFLDPIRVAYVLDLTRPGGMFTASSFTIRDGDTVYVTEAPLVRWIKIMSAISPVVNFAGSVRNLTGQ